MLNFSFFGVFDRYFEGDGERRFFEVRLCFSFRARWDRFDRSAGILARYEQLDARGVGFSWL